jgi:uncharacterized OB-fold protein
MSDQIMQADYQVDAYALAYPETTPFWKSAAEGKLLLKGCDTCGKPHWYPRVVCPLCGSDKTNWTQARGDGTIYSFSLIERADPPYVLAWVELHEGPVLITNIVGCDFKSLKIGDKVHVRFQRTKDGRAVPVFSTEPSAETGEL